uniref:Fas apoptotic inhibitory molecule 1 n=1 Tax=Setaria digitata TaxID=48799 RepID=A0A915PR21_9BILA
MFSLVGKEIFNIGKLKCAISVEALGTFLYEYVLEVNGKSYDKFREEIDRKLKSWITIIDGQNTRICLDKETMDIWVNGQKMTTAGEFLEDGTKTHFEINDSVCYIKATSSGNKKSGFIYQLYINDNEITSTNDAHR